jgi:4-oxalomesaconate tautomerase
MSSGVRCMWMRGGTSKGGFFLAEDLPSDPRARDAFLLRAMGSPDSRQIDGMGGADPLTSKVAVVRRSSRVGIDVDYLFLQVFVDEAIVSDKQNCGNMLAGVAPFAIERGLVHARDGETRVTIHMDNSGQVAVAAVQTPGGRVSYEGDTRIDGVPGTAAPISLAFRDSAGSTCGALLPTGNPVDKIDGIAMTLIDNGMPCVILRADAVGITGHESREALEADEGFKARVEALRLKAGPLMNLGDVSKQSVPKMVLVSRPEAGGAIATRCLIPHRVHASIGVLAAVTVATACLLEGSPAAALATIPEGRMKTKTMAIEHPTGTIPCTVEVDAGGRVVQAGILRTARKLFDGQLFGGSVSIVDGTETVEQLEVEHG